MEYVKISIEEGVNDAVFAVCEGGGKRGRPLTLGWLTRQREGEIWSSDFDWTGGKPLADEGPLLHRNELRTTTVIRKTGCELRGSGKIARLHLEVAFMQALPALEKESHCILSARQSNGEATR